MSVNMRIMLPDYVTNEILKNTINKSIGVLKENQDKIDFYYDSVSLSYKTDTINDRKNKIIKFLNINSYNEENIEKKLENVTNLIGKNSIIQNKKIIDTIGRAAKKNNLVDINESWSTLSSGTYISMIITPFEESDVMQSLVFSDYKNDDKIMPKGKFSVYLNPGSSCHWALLGHRMLEMFGGKMVWSDTKENDDDGNFMIIEKKDALYKPNSKKSKEYNEKLFKEALLKLKNVDDELLSKLSNFGFYATEQSDNIFKAIEKQGSFYLKESLEKELAKNPTTLKNRKIKF